MICINGRFLTEQPTGVQRFAKHLVESLAACRDDLVVVAPRHGHRIDLDGVRVELIGSGGALAWEQWELPGWLRRHGRPVLINPANRAPVLYRRQLSVLHDLIPIHLRSEFSLRFRLQFRLIAWLAVVHGSRKVLTVSEFSREEIRRHYRLRPDRVAVVPNAADAGWLAQGGGTGEAAFGHFVLAFGRSGSNRNTMRCVEAMRLLVDRTDLVLVLAGEPDEALLSAVGDLGDRCVFTGRVPDHVLAGLYRGAIAFLAPSIYEGFDLPPLEAQSAGVPVVASDIPVHREVLGDGALYFDAGSAAELADRIRSLVASPATRADLADRGRRNASRYSWRRSAARLQELIVEVAA